MGNGIKKEGRTAIPPQLRPILAIYLGWPLLTWLVWKVGWLVDINPVAIQAMAIFFLLFFILLASMAILLFLNDLQQWLADNLAHRLGLLLASMALHAGLYRLEAYVGPCQVVLLALLTANLLFFACLLGSWMTMAVKRAAELIPLCAVMVCSDLFSVLAGPTKGFAEEIEVYYSCGMQGQTPLIDFFLVKIAVPGLANLLPVFGVSDWIIIAFLSATMTKFNFNDNLFKGHTGELFRQKQLAIYLPIAALGLIISVLLAQLAHVALPALPMVVGCFLFYLLVTQPEARELQKREWQLLFGFSILMLGLLLLLL